MLATTSTAIAKIPPHVPEYAPLFDEMTQGMQAALDEVLAQTKGVVFRTNAGDLFELFLKALPEEDRQYHTCNTCRSFFNHYASLVQIDADGEVYPVLWKLERTPTPYLNSVTAVRNALLKAPIIGQFLWDQSMWGVPEAGGFTHLWARPDEKYRHTRKDLTAAQLMAAKLEDHKNLALAVIDLPEPLVARTVEMLTAGDLNRGEKLAPQGQFLLDLQRTLQGQRNKRTCNKILWRAVATAPAGWCSPRSSALGALVADLKAGASVHEAKAKHDARMHPLQYQRPSVPVSEGNVKQAEKLFEKLGLEKALKRRFALASEVPYIWQPVPLTKKDKEGIFGHLLEPAKDPEARIASAPQHMTFSRFRKTILPNVLSMEVLVPSSGNFCAYTTQEDPDAPPILQWDAEDARNPFAWFVYHNGSSASNWNLRGNDAIPVLGFTLMPTAWKDEARNSHHGAGVLVVIKDCMDRRESGLALFPECLKSELHPVRATIEAHSKTGKIARPEGQYASGLVMNDNSPVTIFTHTSAGTAAYVLDRWE